MASRYFACVKRFRRISLVIGFLALQLASLSGGPGCPIPTGGDALNGATAAMAGMRDMPEMIATDAAASENVPAGPDATRSDKSASHTPAPQAPCTTMAVCAFASAPAVVEAPVNALLDVSDVMLPQYAMALAAILSAPETPPPRV